MSIAGGKSPLVREMPQQVDETKAAAAAPKGKSARRKTISELLAPVGVGTLAGGEAQGEACDDASAAMSSNPLFAFGTDAGAGAAADEVVDAEAARKARRDRRKSRKSVPKKRIR